jgi:hypothetical protein
MSFDYYLDRQIDDYCNAPQDLDERDIMLIAKKYDLELHLDEKEIVGFANEIIREWKELNG